MINLSAIVSTTNLSFLVHVVSHLMFPLPTFKGLVSSPRGRSSAASLAMVLNTLNSPHWWHYLRSHGVLHTSQQHKRGLLQEHEPHVMYNRLPHLADMYNR